MEKHLYLLDGHALAYRAYFAMIRNPLTNSKGTPTGAVFGFALYLLKLLKDYQCPYIAVIFDSRKPTFRHELYDQYKAHRPEMPDDMKVQLPLIFELVEAFGLPRIVKDGVEADDIIAHLTRKASNEGFSVSVVSRDKDLMQLVGGSVRMLAPTDGGGMRPMGVAEVIEKMGVPPEKIRDLLALMGDASDNIPGVQGVGPKTAIKILESAGSLENLLQNPSCINNPKLQAKIEQSRNEILLSKELTTLRYDVDLDITLDSLAFCPLPVDACVAFFKEMEFTSLLNDPLFDRKKEMSLQVTIPKSLDEIRLFVDKATSAGFVSIDTETTSTTPREAALVGISLALDEMNALYIPVGHDAPDGEYSNLDVNDVIAILRPLVESPSIKKIGQNLKYDMQVFRNYGCVMKGIAFDAMIAAYLIDPGKRQYSLDALASLYLSLKTIPIEDLIGKGASQRSFSTVKIGDAAKYSAEDVSLPIRLKALFEPLLSAGNLADLFANIELPLLTVLADMEWEGTAIDRQFLSEMSKEFTIKLSAIAQEIHRIAGEEFNLNSPKQVAEVLFVKLALPAGKKTKGKTGLSTDVDALEKLAPDYPIAKKMLEHREVQKLLSTYIDALPQQVSAVDNRIHSSFNQTIAATGRLSSTNPNLQNIPVRTDDGRRIREAFVAPPGAMIVSADYSQIELRILAHCSGDPLLVKAFLDDKDIHTQTASAIYGIFPEMVTQEMRRGAKTINFGLMYGMGPINLARQLGISFREAQVFIDTYFLQFPTIQTFMQTAINAAREKGYAETLLGRRRNLPDINAETRMVREAAERTAINTPIQGTAADIIKIAMINLHRVLPEKYPQVKMILQVHDELVFEVPQEQSEGFCRWVTGVMGDAFKLDVPLKVEARAGKNWATAH